MNGTSTVSQVLDAVQGPKLARHRRPLQIALSLSAAVALVGYVLPRVVGTTAHDVVGAFSEVSGTELVGLSLLWFAGLYVHSFVLTGALPGLTRPRALTLNLTGSGVANLLPFGGAVGMALNYVMIRAWSASRTRFASYTFVTNVWVVMLKLLMPAVALVAMLATGAQVGHSLGLAAAIAAALLAGVVGALALGLANRHLATRGAAVGAGFSARLSGFFRGRVDAASLEEELLACRDTVAEVVGRQWLQLSTAMIGYAALQALLLYAALAAVGAHVSPTQALAAFAVDRVMSLVVLTPGGLGFSEAGTAAALVAFGVAPAPAAAGVLLYRAFTFAIEIPIGLTWLAGWVMARRIALRRELQSGVV